MKLKGIHILAVDDIKVIYESEASIARAFQQSGKSQAKIAAETGVNPSTISRYKSKTKTAKRTPKISTLKRLVKVLGVKASSLYPELR